MALHTLGTKAATSLNCLPAWSQVLAAADLAAIGQSISGDGRLGTILGQSYAGETAVIATGTTSGTSITGLSAQSGSPPISQIKVGNLVLGVGIVPGTFVTAISGTTATLSQAVSSGAGGTYCLFLTFETPLLGQEGQLRIPGRGVLKMLAGDIVAIDNTGWPILVPQNVINYAGSLWTFT